MPKRKKKVRVIKRVNVVAADEPGKVCEDSSRNDDKDPLLNDSLRSNVSTSVLYSTAGAPYLDSSDRQATTRPKNPSINSKV